MTTHATATRATGARLLPEQRRQQIIDVAVQMFGDPAHADVSLEDIARVAGVSRNLVYHYFPGRDALIVAASQSESARLNALAARDADLDGPERVEAMLNTYFDFVQTNPHGYRMLYRYASQNAETRAILDGNLDRYTGWVLSWLDNPSPATRLAVRSWMSFLVFACLRWLESPDVTRAEVIRICSEMFGTALSSTGQTLT